MGEFWKLDRTNKYKHTVFVSVLGIRMQECIVVQCACAHEQSIYEIILHQYGPLLRPLRGGGENWFYKCVYICVYVCLCVDEKWLSALQM